MTPQESIDTIRMLLDSDHEYYYPMQRVIEAINSAQNFMIHALNMANDERGLRPLYDVLSRSLTLRNTSVLPQDCMYPKGLNIYPTASNPALFYAAEYLDYDRYIVLTPRPGAYMNARFRHSIYWTYTRQWNSVTNQEDTVLLCSVDSTLTALGYRADVSYIRRPNPFTYTQTPLTDTPIALPSEYHYSVIAIAAEMINNIDVGEMERSEAAYPQQGGLTFTTSGEIK